MSQRLPTNVSVTLDGRAVLSDVTLEVRAGRGPRPRRTERRGQVDPAVRAERRTASGCRDDHAGRPPAVELLGTRTRPEPAVLTQENTLSFPFRVREVLEMGRSPWARTPQLADDDRALAEAAERADVAGLLDRRFTELSGGERARVSLARVLAQDTADRLPRRADGRARPAASGGRAAGRPRARRRRARGGRGAARPVARGSRRRSRRASRGRPPRRARPAGARCSPHPRCRRSTGCGSRSSSATGHCWSCRCVRIIPGADPLSRSVTYPGIHGMADLRGRRRCGDRRRPSSLSARAGST